LQFEPTFLGDFEPYDATRFRARYRFEPAAAAEPAWLASYRNDPSTVPPVRADDGPESR
jgi:hypothetical protein